MNITELYQLYAKNYLVDTDTRTIRKNTLFFCLKGANFNGNTFAAKAIALGAAYAIVDEPAYKTHANIILVNNVLKTLQKLANYHRKALKTTIIGLTGSNGKTTTKELINAVLGKKYKTLATVGNLNNHIGVPLTLLSFTPTTEMGIVEMGANHQKEIDFLCTICEPDFGYITNFGKAHLEGFGGVEGVIKGKTELYRFIKKNNKTVFINPEDKIQVTHSKNLNTVEFANNITLSGLNPFISIAYQSLQIQSNLIGSYNYTNIAAAITIAAYFKVPTKAIKEAIEAYIPNNNRSQIIQTANNKIILDAYNANPTSTKAALESFANIEASNKSVILGDMFELGTNSATEHQNIVLLTNTLQFSTVYFVGEHYYGTTTDNLKFKTFKDLENHIKTHPLNNQFILIKGSRGMRLERLLENIS